MTELAFSIFWLGVLIIFYTYLGYGFIISLIAKFVKRKHYEVLSDKDLPEITVLIAAYNEQDYIVDKIENTLSLDYPSEKLSVVFVTDGSSDSTPEIIRQYPNVTLYHEPQRKGKIHAVNRVMRFITTPIVIFSDANTFLNKEALKNIVRHYQDEKVGGVAGEKRIFKKTEDNASGAGEGLYWKYESFLKRKDSEVYSVVGAAGELFSVRTALYEEPGENIIIEDFYMSLSICSKGYRFIYEPNAYATETASASVKEEWKRKVRICAGAFQAMVKLGYLLNPFKYGMLSFQYISHRVLRWTLAPLALPFIFISNLWLAMQYNPFYITASLGQIAFYALAFIGYFVSNKKVSIKGFFVPYYFCVMNFSVYAGFVRFLKGKQSVVWEKSRRAAVSA
ncbi:glycosyltransferase family 2 protein [Chryseosolibacter indicus]|uniref:Glycosyltransferase family 2 protein n=1 Tax=Chryseosolibacter indicus TaxID=2782351 RepID=A0ABS5VSR0_9BACT|nr:glycosyltransferase family 2 protein [Chryseosolibacter indicus]MBT1704470.1 glycosyltransferase family 2 protein [Chryseosolibacter indicus]